MSRRKEVNIPKKLIILILLIIIIALVFICKSIVTKNKSLNNNTVAGLDISKYKDYEVPIAYYYYGIQNKNFDVFLKAYPEFMGISSQFSADDLNNFYETYKDECGENIKINYEIGDAVQYTEEQLADLENYLKANYQQEIQVSQAYTVNITEKYTGDKQTIESKKTQIVFQFNGQWYSL